MNSVTYPLSDKDIRLMTGNKCNIIRYSDLKYVDNIDDILNFGCCFILYQWEKINKGHWCLLCVTKTGLEFFDPYSTIPDENLEYVNNKSRFMLNANYTYLADLLCRSNYNIEYNEFPFQRKQYGINSCGRWCVLRKICNDMGIDLYTFEKMFPPQISDLLVTKLTKI